MTRYHRFFYSDQEEQFSRFHNIGGLFKYVETMYFLRYVRNQSLIKWEMTGLPIQSVISINYSISID